MNNPVNEHSVPPVFLERFREALLSRGADAARAPDMVLDSDGRDALFYIPFEHVNTAAKIVLVGITPGWNQIKLAYGKVQELLQAGINDEEAIRRAKSFAGFGGSAMRPNLLKMLRHFDFAGFLRIKSEDDLWGHRSELLHATSVIPHAAFRNEKMFSGSFDDVLRSAVFRKSFERDFVASLKRLSAEALFVALGRTPLAALDWCANRGYIEPTRILGSLAHPSTSGGSSVGIYLGEKKLEDLSPNDPVRHRAKDLTSDYQRLKLAMSFHRTVQNHY